jgi:triosephosphate isomerase (TIM)
MTSIRPLIAGNWKMNGLKSALAELTKLDGAVARDGMAANVDIFVCPPATLIAQSVWTLRDSQIAVGAQDCRAEDAGAYTGDVSAPMLADSGAKAVILGHSERRALHGERDIDVRAKAEAAHRAGLAAIVCVGETAGERRLGLTLAVIARQLRGSLPKDATAANTVIAYEPVWAIGTGLTPTPADIAEVHHFIRVELAGLLGQAVADATRILYGGSVKPNNAAELLTIAGVDGALVGGASLLADDFLPIIAARSAKSA